MGSFDLDMCGKRTCSPLQFFREIFLFKGSERSSKFHPFPFEFTLGKKRASTFSSYPVSFLFFLGRGFPKIPGTTGIPLEFPPTAFELRKLNYQPATRMFSLDGSHHLEEHWLPGTDRTWMGPPLRNRHA